MAGILNFNDIHGNPDKGTYALTLQTPLNDISILVKKCGTPDESFTSIDLSGSVYKKITQRNCDQVMIAAVKAEIKTYTPGELTEVSKNCWRYQVCSDITWHVDSLGQEGERFWGNYLLLPEPEQEISPSEIMAFKAILGIEDFEADCLPC